VEDGREETVNGSMAGSAIWHSIGALCAAHGVNAQKHRQHIKRIAARAARRRALCVRHARAQRVTHKLSACARINTRCAALLQTRGVCARASRGSSSKSTWRAADASGATAARMHRDITLFSRSCARLLWKRARHRETLRRASWRYRAYACRTRVARSFWRERHPHATRHLYVTILTSAVTPARLLIAFRAASSYARRA